MPGQQLVNPSITSPRTGDRSKASRVSPRNMTGQRYAEQHAEKDARDASKAKLASLDVESVKRQAFEDGFNKGYDSGSEAGQETCARVLMALYQEEGIKAVEDLLKEWIAGDEADHADAAE